MMVRGREQVRFEGVLEVNRMLAAVSHDGAWRL